MGTEHAALLKHRPVSEQSTFGRNEPRFCTSNRGQLFSRACIATFHHQTWLNMFAHCYSQRYPIDHLNCELRNGQASSGTFERSLLPMGMVVTSLQLLHKFLAIHVHVQHYAHGPEQHSVCILLVDQGCAPYTRGHLKDAGLGCKKCFLPGALKLGAAPPHGS